MFKVNTDYESSLKVGCWVLSKIQCFIFCAFEGGCQILEH